MPEQPPPAAADACQDDSRPDEGAPLGGAAQGPEAAAAAPNGVGGGTAEGRDVDPEASELECPSTAFELDTVAVCGLRLHMLRRRTDFFAACAGDLPVKSTGTVLWECGVLLADYLGYARWVDGGDGDDSANQNTPPRPWWMLHPPAAVVPTRFWSSPERGRVLELGGGCGLVAAVLASLGADVLCTDGDPTALRTAAQNCADAQRRHDSARCTWGNVRFKVLKWGDTEAARAVCREYGPFRLIVGSDLLYGIAAPPAPLVETLAVLCAETAAAGSPAEVFVAAKNRCRNEVEGFTRMAESRGLWRVRLTDPEEFIEGFQGLYTSADASEECPAYGIIRLSPKADPAASDTADARILAPESVATSDAPPHEKRARLGPAQEPAPGGVDLVGG